MAPTDFMRPFVLPVAVRPAERHGPTDLYLPDAEGPRPAVVVVHGGPLPAGLRPTPREWPVYRGYGSAIAGRSLVAAVVDHPLHSTADYPAAAATLDAAIAAVRADPRVDADRLAVWYFSGGSPLLSDRLADPPDWLRCVAATYPLLAPIEGFDWDERFRPVRDVASAGRLPIVLTRVGRERPAIAETVAAFVAAARAAGADLHIVDVPDGQHIFDVLDDTDASREAITAALDAVTARLTAGR